MKRILTIVFAIVLLSFSAISFTSCDGSNTDNGDGMASLSGTVVIRGSTSVEPLMNALIDSYLTLNGARTANVEFDIDCQGSGAGRTTAGEDTTGTVIGMASSPLTASHLTTGKGLSNNFNIALDAVAVIVHKNNPLNEISLVFIKNTFNTHTF